MATKPADRDQIIMNFNRPPAVEDIEVLAVSTLSALPDELSEYTEALAIKVEEFPDDAVYQDLELDDPYELIALYQSGSQISPGVTRKTVSDDDVLVIYRRPLLDMWCETGDDLALLIRNILIEEIATHFEIPENDIEEMVAQHFQGML